MPLPTVQSGESREEFIARCLSNEQANNDFPDTDQRLAVCGDIFDRSRERTMTVNERLLAAVKSRQPKLTRFHRGILTADWYVKSLGEGIGPELCHKYMATRHASFDDVLRKAASTLVYSNTDMEVEEIYGEKSKLPKGVELPKDTLMVFRHVLTTNTKDRDGDILRTEGAEVDPKMLLLWQHVHTMPIGKMLAVVKQSKSRLELVSAIVDINEVSHDAAVMIDNKMGRFSHGFRAIEFEEMEPDKGEEGPGGFDIKRFEIMEESLVSVPANPDAEMTDVLLSLVEGGKLTSGLMKEYGKTIRRNRPVTVPGVEITYKEQMGEWNRELSCGTLADLKAAHDAGLIGVKTDEDESGGGGEKAGEGSSGTPEKADGNEKKKEEVAGDAEVKAKRAYREKQRESAVQRAMEAFERSQQDKAADGEAKKPDTKFYGDLSGSFEWINSRLSSKTKRHLILNEVNVGEDDWVRLLATYPDHAIISYETRTGDEFFYSAKWKMVGDEPEYVDGLKEVEVKVEVSKSSTGRRMKAGRSLSKANEERLREAKSIVDEVVGMKDLIRPAKAMLKEAATTLDAILIGLGGEDGEADALTVEKAAAHILANADGRQMDRLVRSIRAIERSAEKNKRLAKFRSLKR